MVLGVVFASLAGAGREKMQNRTGAETPGHKRTGHFAVGIVMVVIAGVLSVGWGFAFTYSYDTIVKAMMAHGAAGFPARISVWAIALPGAALPNILYPALLMTRNSSWRVLASHPRRDRSLGDLRDSLPYGDRAAQRRDVGDGIGRSVGGLGIGTRHADPWRPNSRFSQR